MDHNKSVLQSAKVQRIIAALSDKVSKESKRPEGKAHPVKFDDTDTPIASEKLETLLHDPVPEGRFEGYVNNITGNGSGTQMEPYGDDVL